MIYFTADTHFGHENIIKHCKRPFANADEMDRVMIANWNARVKQSDQVFHLGDFAWWKKGETGAETVARYRRQLNGHIVCLQGNHDPSNFGPDVVNITADGQMIVLCHYAMRVWDQSHRGALMFFGHSHGALAATNQSCDVGVDCWDFQPVTLAEIRRFLSMQRPQ